MGVPAVMPVISRDVPAFTNDDFSGAFPAAHANNSTYGGTNYWRCVTAPTGNTDSGTLTQAVYLAYDLSSVSSSQRQNIVAVWYNDPTTDPYDSSLISTNYYNVPKDYTIDTNTGAGGGSPPGSGWTTRVTVTSNPYHSRQHAFNLNGANWLRINVTGINGSALNNNCALNMDVHDAHLGNQDNWIFYGDSITQAGLDHDDANNGPILPAQINTLQGTNVPLMENGGVGGFSAADGAAHISTWLPFFSGKYVGLNYGTNDANGGGSLMTNFISNMTTMINAVIGAGKIPIMHKTIVQSLTTNVQTNGPTLNGYIQTLKSTFPSLILGPDLWAYFGANPSLISGDNIHPTLGAGYTAYRQQWATSLAASVYTAASASVLVGHKHKVGAIQ